MSYGVPKFSSFEFDDRSKDYCVLIPIINEKGLIEKELERAFNAEVYRVADIVICDGGSTDGCTDHDDLKKFKVNTLLVKEDKGKQGAQLRMGFSWAIKRGYKGFITIDGNNKDSIEDVPRFIEKLNEGYAFIQGSRFVKGGQAINTPLSRTIAVKLIHAPIISMTAHKRYTDTTNAYRGYSSEYITDPRVDIFRDIFDTYELLAYLSVRADQLKMKTCEIPVTRAYPKTGNTPTKIHGFSGNWLLFKILIQNAFGKFKPEKCK